MGSPLTDVKLVRMCVALGVAVEQPGQQRAPGPLSLADERQRLADRDDVVASNLKRLLGAFPEMGRAADQVEQLLGTCGLAGRGLLDARETRLQVGRDRAVAVDVGRLDGRGRARGPFALAPASVLDLLAFDLVRLSPRPFRLRPFRLAHRRDSRRVGTAAGGAGTLSFSPRS